MLAHGEFQYVIAPLAVLSDDGVHVSGIKLIRNKLADPDASGRRRPIPIPGSEFVIEADTVIPAFGQYSDPSWLHADELKLEVSRRTGIPLVDRETWMTSYPGLFAGGDYTDGSRNLISAIADGPDAAIAINLYLGGEDKTPEPPEEIELPDYRPGMVHDYESIPFEFIPALPLDKRYSFTPHAQPHYTPPDAL